MSLYNLVVPLGITAYSMVLITFISGLLRIKPKLHRLEAYIAISLATLHALLIIYLKYFK